MGTFSSLKAWGAIYSNPKHMAKGEKKLKVKLRNAPISM
jgi:hypothetical protein